MDMLNNKPRIAVIIPCYKVTQQVLSVLAQIPAEVWRIYVVDDFCPNKTGQFVQQNVNDTRVHFLFHQHNQGVGGAVMTGYTAAIADGADILVKLDGDGQMAPYLIPSFVAPIVAGVADYTKGNRFFSLAKIRAMPNIRIFGNLILSFMAKLSSGYWTLFDPTNGYTAIHVDVARFLPFEKINKRYFFESDMLFHLNILRAVVVDVPMEAQYGEEESQLKISKVVFPFLFKHIRNFFKRLFYNYYLRDLSLASIELPLGVLLLLFGIVFGSYHWYKSVEYGIGATAGTVMLSALPILMGVQLILAFLNYDIASIPRNIVHKRVNE